MMGFARFRVVFLATACRAAPILRSDYPIQHLGRCRVARSCRESGGSRTLFSRPKDQRTAAFIYFNADSSQCLVGWVQRERPCPKTQSRFARNPSSGRERQTARPFDHSDRPPHPTSAIIIVAADSPRGQPLGRCSVARNTSRPACCRCCPSRRSSGLVLRFGLPSPAACGCARKYSGSWRCA